MARSSPLSRRTVISRASLLVIFSSIAFPATPPATPPRTAATVDSLPCPTPLPATPPTTPLAALDGHLAHRFHGGETHQLLSPGFMFVVNICRFMGGATGERCRECGEEDRRFHGLSFPR